MEKKKKQFNPNPTLSKERQEEIERILRENEESKPIINKKKLTKIDKVIIEMWELRQKYIADGGRLYSEEEVERMINGYIV